MIFSLVLFVYLQILDVLTTLIFLAHGQSEGNPVAAALMRALGTVGGLLLLKGVAVVGALIVTHRKRYKLLKLANALSAGVVTWNLAWILALTP